MQRKPVASSSVSSVGYDRATSVLEIEFASGSVYRYFMVPRRVAEGLVSAESKGRYVHAHIRDAYTAERVG